MATYGRDEEEDLGLYGPSFKLHLRSLKLPPLNECVLIPTITSAGGYQDLLRCHELSRNRVTLTEFDGTGDTSPLLDVPKDCC